MSDEMMEDPTPSPFEMLSEDPILHICSFLPGADLIQLSSINKKFKRIITKTPETTRKLPLLLDFDKDDLDLDDAIEIAQTRRFTALRLFSVHKLIDAEIKVKFCKLLEMLSGSVDYLTVWSHTSPELLPSTIASLLPKLKKCELYNVSFSAESTANFGVMNSQSNASYPLESLKVIDTFASAVLKFFPDCNQLKTFRYERGDDVYIMEEFVHLNNFLAKQGRLEKLVCTVRGLDFDRLICYQLKDLSINCWSDIDHVATATFLSKLPHLETLEIVVYGHLSRRLMGVICALPKLKKLSIETWWYQVDDDGDSLNELVNRTVKELHILDSTNITSKLLTIFLGVDTICLAVITDVLNLSGVSPETIMKIKVHQRYCNNFFVKFSPRELPTNVEAFQSAVMTFAEEFHEYIEGIEIGHESWYSRGDFMLSNSFCEGLVSKLRRLRKLELYNMENRDNYITFLHTNRDKLSLELEDIFLHMADAAAVN